MNKHKLDVIADQILDGAEVPSLANPEEESSVQIIHMLHRHLSPAKPESQLSERIRLKLMKDWSQHKKRIPGISQRKLIPALGIAFSILALILFAVILPQTIISPLTGSAGTTGILLPVLAGLAIIGGIVSWFFTTRRRKK